MGNIGSHVDLTSETKPHQASLNPGSDRVDLAFAGEDFRYKIVIPCT